MTTPERTPLSVLTLPAFNDNYLWLIHDGSNAAIVDPGQAAPVKAALAAHALRLTAILLTHHHADHIGGVPALLCDHDVPVYGPRNDGIDCVTHPLGDGERVDVPGLDLALEVMDVPGHTLGHIAYVRRDSGANWLFCGDTLFGAGCGRLFEGTPRQMMTSLSRLARLPEDTLVYCAHEYTLSNLRFAQAVEPDNAALERRVAADSATRAADRPTVPSTIGLEKATNPFLRHGASRIVQSLRETGRLTPGATEVDTFAALREWKNTF